MPATVILATAAELSTPAQPVDISAFACHSCSSVCVIVSYCTVVCWSCCLYGVLKKELSTFGQDASAVTYDVPSGTLLVGGSPEF